MKQNVHIILASESPRRRDLLTQAGLSFDVNKSNADENCDIDEPSRYVISLASLKSNEVAERFIGKCNKDTLIVAADTIVALGNDILGKPKDPDDALKTLMNLSGKSHAVYTGVMCALIKAGADSVSDSFSFYEKTTVNMYDFTEYEALDYIATGEPFDKAGSYGIQGFGVRLVKSIEGDYNNVVGFPLSEFIRELNNRGFISFV